MNCGSLLALISLQAMKSRSPPPPPPCPPVSSLLSALVVVQQIIAGMSNPALHLLLDAVGFLRLWDQSW